MKRYLIIMLIELIYFSSFGQLTCVSVTCNGKPAWVNADGSFDYSKFDWTNQDRCNWMRYPSGGGPACVKPPFISSSDMTSPSMLDIYANFDYLNNDPTHVNTGVPSTVNKDMGWELIGAKFDEKSPYFVLYNKKKAIVRAFFYTGDNAGISYYSIACTYTHQGPSLLGTASDPAKAEDKYDGTEPMDIVVKACDPKTIQETWVCADFPVLFDYKIQSIATSSSLMTFLFVGMSQYDIKIKGSSNSVFSDVGDHEIATNSSDFKPGASFNAANSELKEFFTSASELTEALSTEEQQTPSLSILADFKNKLVHITQGSTPDDKKISLTNIFKAASAVSGLIGAAVGLYEVFTGTPEETTPPYGAGYTIELGGTAVLSSNLSGGNVKIPGTYGTVGADPLTNLYNCPMGRINLAKTPSLLRSPDYGRRPQPSTSFVHTYDDVFLKWEPNLTADKASYKGNYIKYKLNEDIQLVVNELLDASGNIYSKLTDVKYAFKFQPSQYKHIENDDKQGLDDNYYDGTMPIIGYAWYHHSDIDGTFDYKEAMPNPVYHDIQKGIFQVYKYDATYERHVYGTPYLDPKTFKGITFEIPQYSNITLSVLCFFTDTRSGKISTILQEFNVDKGQGSTAPIGVYDLNEWTFDYPLSAYYVNPNSVTPYDLVLFDPNSNASKTASHSIAMLPGFSGVTGFSASYAQSFIYNGGTDPTVKNSYPNCANSQEQRIASSSFTNANPVINASASDKVTVYPNPSNGILNIGIDYDTQNSVDVAIYNVLGEEIYSYNGDGIDKKVLEADLNDHSEGLYVVKVKVGDNVTTHRVVVTK